MDIVIYPTNMPLGMSVVERVDITITPEAISLGLSVSSGGAPLLRMHVYGAGAARAFAAGLVAIADKMDAAEAAKVAS